MQKRRFAAARLTAALGAILFAFPGAAEARVRVLHIYFDATHNDPIVQADPLEAIEFIAARLSPGVSNIGWACGGEGWIVTTSAMVTGRSVTVNCQNAGSFTFAYAEAIEVYVSGEGNSLWTGFRRPGAPQVANFGFARNEEQQARRFAELWRFLGSRRAMLDPATDAAFQAQVEAERAQGLDSEGLRRAQVQFSVLVREGRTIEAARMYRDRMRTAASWADGHYNLALAYAELELYPEAITEMRRFLYLEPNASDARAATDQIYQWEALLPPQR